LRKRILAIIQNQQFIPEDPSVVAAEIRESMYERDRMSQLQRYKGICEKIATQIHGHMHEAKNRIGIEFEITQDNVAYPEPKGFPKGLDRLSANLAIILLRIPPRLYRYRTTYMFAAEDRSCILLRYFSVLRDGSNDSNIVDTDWEELFRFN